ncbi:MAG TPA: tetratricopeptide repeat protein [Vicinamibacterales bacterium]|nr:tetratricopeptide repeat protein [Vicinamibacterales bacterium]
MTAVTAVLLWLALASSPQQDARAEAERLANAGAHAAALERFQEIAAANPDDIQARLWIGRLHLVMRQPVRAAAVFESILATSPQELDALTGLAVALMDAGRWSEAADALNRAEALAADRIDVLSAQGRFHAAEGRTTLALAYYGRALAADPGNASIRAAVDDVRAVHGHRVTIGYDMQAFDPSAAEMHAGTLEVNVRVTDRVRLFGRGQAQSFEGETEGRGGAGFEWLMRPRVRIRAGGLFGSDTFWLPGVDGFADLAYVSGRATWTLSARYVDFSGGDLWIGGPGLAMSLTPRLTLHLQYLRGRTGIDAGDSTTTDGGTIGLAARVTPRFRTSVAYHRGFDRLDWFTRDRFGASEANTGTVGAELDLTRLASFAASYAYQDRGNTRRVHRASGQLTVRF